MEDNLTIERFNVFVEKSGLTKKLLADKLGVTAGFISSICHQRNGFSGKFYRGMIENGYGEELIWIITGKNLRNESIEQELKDAYKLIESLERILKK